MASPFPLHRTFHPHTRVSVRRRTRDLLAAIAARLRLIAASPESLRIPILLAGVVLRLRQYVFDRSLWYDETLIALNIIGRPFTKLVPPMENHQGAPFGFLALAKGAVVAFGSSEYALRLVPVAAGIAALFLFDRLLRRTVDARAHMIALALFALSAIQVDFSTEVKPYSLDTTVAVLLLMGGISLAGPSPSVRRMAGMAVGGAIAVWFSYPSMFMLAGIGTVLALAAARRRDWKLVTRLAGMSAVWAASFTVCYVLTLRPVNNDPLMKQIWAEAFLPWQASYWTLEWIWDRLFGMFGDPTGVVLSGLGALAFVVGCLQRRDAERNAQFYLIVTPLLPALGAAFLHRYPFEGRFLNFLVPSLLLVIGVGISAIISSTRLQTSTIGGALVALVFFHPVWNDTYYLVRPRRQEEIRPVLDYVRTHRQADDRIYLYWRAEPAFAYYAGRWKDPRLEEGRTPHRHWSTDSQGIGDIEVLDTTGHAGRTQRFIEELAPLAGHQRVWVVFYHVALQNGVTEEELFRRELDRRGVQRDHFEQPGASAYLYDLSAAPDPNVARASQLSPGIAGELRP